MVAGSITDNGYVVISTDTKHYYAHRLAWLYTYGKLPDSLIDHINGIKHDNRMVNLREANKSQNAFNTGVKSTNKSGYKGVSWRSQNKKWIAHIRISGKSVYLGSFDNIEDAAEMYATTAKQYHKNYYNTTSET